MLHKSEQPGFDGTAFQPGGFHLPRRARSLNRKVGQGDGAVSAGSKFLNKNVDETGSAIAGTKNTASLAASTPTNAAVKNSAAMARLMAK